MRHLFTFILVLITFLIPAQSAYSGNIDNARKSFYGNNYEDAINHYHKALKNNEAEKSEINYRIGLCYFILGYFEKSSGYWAVAKDENASIFKGKIFRQPSASMMPTLLIGDLIIADSEYYLYSNIKRNDVVVLLSPKDKKTLYFKRVVALPGETVEIKNKELFINGKKANSNKVVFDNPNIIPASEAPRDNFGPVTIADGTYFVMGDNRDYSFDSRHFGAVDKELILGKALIIYGSTPSKDSMENDPNRTGIIINPKSAFKKDMSVELSLSRHFMN